MGQHRLQGICLAKWLYDIDAKWCTLIAKGVCAAMYKIQKGYDSESKTFRLPIELIEKLQALADKNKLSLNQLVIQCLNYAVDNIENDDEQTTEGPT